jgi:hypothetical protein
MMPDQPHPADKDQPAEGGRREATDRSTADKGGEPDEIGGIDDGGKATPSPEQAERNREDDPPA